MRSGYLTTRFTIQICKVHLTSKFTESILKVLFDFLEGLHNVVKSFMKLHIYNQRLRTPSEEIAFTARPKIKSQSQIFSYGRSIFCLPHRPKFSNYFDFCLQWVSVVRAYNNSYIYFTAYCVTRYFVFSSED